MSSAVEKAQQLLEETTGAKTVEGEGQRLEGRPSITVRLGDTDNDPSDFEVVWKGLWSNVEVKLVHRIINAEWDERFKVQQLTPEEYAKYLKVRNNG